MKIEIVFTDKDCFIVIGGKKVLQRGDMEWVPLEPGWSAVSPPDHDFIDIMFHGQHARVQ